MIRVGTAGDTARIAEIYRPYVTESAISFEETPPDAAEIGRRMEAAHLWLVDETANLGGGGLVKQGAAQ